jgi:PIN domain nuclease of toxin-antitoxin system
MDAIIANLQLTILPVTVEYADRQSTLPPHHKDPFDRFLIAQALVEGIPVVSVDAAFDPYGIARIW